MTDIPPTPMSPMRFTFFAVVVGDEVAHVLTIGETRPDIVAALSSDPKIIKLTESEMLEVGVGYHLVSETSEPRFEYREEE